MDFYKITVPAGDTRYFSLTTATPADGVGQFVNLLNPNLQLYDSQGTLLATDDDSAADGRNARLYYAIAPAGGTYYVEVLASDALGSASPSAGEYVLCVDVKSGPVPVPGITVSKPSVTTTEAGGTDTFTLVLNTDPGTNVTVTIGLSSSNITEGMIDSNTLTFTGGAGGNWSTPQTVTVTGVNDFVDDGDIPYTIVTAPASAADTSSLYHNMPVADVAAINLDNDTAGITVSPTSITTYEDQMKLAATFTVVLTSQPLEDVTIDVSSSDTSEGTIDRNTLTFTGGMLAIGVRRRRSR